jgi:ribosome-binding protein aMBF1 (putative translation factor)
MAEEAATLDSQLDADLEALLGPDKPVAPAAAAGVKPGEKAPPVASPEAPEKPADGEEDPLLKALDALDDGEPKEDGEPKSGLTSDQKSVLEAIPDIQTATNLYGVVQNYNTFTNALAEGRFEDVESMLSDWNPQVIEKWMEHIYKTRGEELVDRFISENDPNAPKESKDILALRKKITALETAVEGKKKSNVQQTEAERSQSAFQEYNKYVNSLFDKIEFNKNDRRWVTADLNHRIAADPKVLAAVKSGDVKSVTKLFKTVCKEYLTRDKEVVDGAADKVAAQEKKKLPLGGGAGGEVDAVPEDIRSVKKGDEDAWLDKTLNGFLGKVLGKKK